MIRLVDLTQHYGIRPILRGINLEIPAGELVAVMGPNGMGKSTLLAAMAGILSPQKGYVEIDGLRRRRTEDEELAIRRKVVYLPDTPWLPAMRTGREFLVAVGRLYDIDYDRLFDHVERLFKLFNLEGQADAPISSYSTGQKKKIAVASALVTEAPILIMDEPFSGGLDPSALLALKKVMKRLSEREDTTVVMATPVPEIVEGLAHRIAIIRDGQLIAYDTPENLLAQTPDAKNVAELLERLINPHTLEHIDEYFGGSE